MLYTNQKYCDPKDVLNSIVDDFAQKVAVGEQKDLGEFNLILLERIEEGLNEENMLSQGRRESILTTTAISDLNESSLIETEET